MRPMRRIRRALACAAVALFAATPALAQDSASPRAPATAVERARLERQFRQRVGRAVQARLQLSDAQMARLQKTNQSFEGRRHTLVAEERQIRAGIAEQIGAGERADQAAVAKLIDRAIVIQRERLDLVEQEQRELSSFLTPVQRARYLDLQERLRRRVEELRRNQQRGGPGGRRQAPGRR